MKITHFHAACQIIETADLRILTDPWLGLGANWDGSWGPGAVLPSTEAIIRHIGPVHLIYISHVHDDHYCPEFLRAYRTQYPEAKLLVANEPILLRAMAHDGLVPQLVLTKPMQIGQTMVTIHPNGRDAIDSALVVRAGEYAAVHLNDCLWDNEQVASIKRACDGATRVAGLLPYLGAGEWPGSYTMTETERAQAITQKQRQFCDLFIRYATALSVKWAIPIAGESEYVGPLARLQPLRGLPMSALSVLWDKGPLDSTPWDRWHVPVLAYGDTLDMQTGWTGTNISACPPAPTRPFQGYRYERDFASFPQADLLPVLPNLAIAAGRKAALKAALDKPFWYCVGTEAACMAAIDFSGLGMPHRGPLPWSRVADFCPREEVIVDPRHLFGLLTGLYHWNVALGGGHLQCKRTPLGDYREKLYHETLNHFHV